MEKVLLKMTARELRDLLKKKEISPFDLLDIIEIQIDKIDKSVNAIPTLCFDRARHKANLKSLSNLPLAGLPVAIKDLSAVAGVRTTWGSQLYRNHIPKKSDYVVERIENAGGLIYGKTNTPEFGTGANTFNNVFGITRNPWNTDLSASGSSGGSAVALATGMAWLATGSDLAGSLRTPASFCGVVGFRPSQGRIASNSDSLAFNHMNTDGPMARNVLDSAMFLDVMAGYDQRDPMSLDDPIQSFEVLASKKDVPKKIAFSKNLGITPVDQEVATICEKAASKFFEFGSTVIDDHPDFSGLEEVFQTHRAISFASSFGTNLEYYRSILSPEIIWNTEKGLALRSDEIIEAMANRSKIYKRTIDFFSRYDLLVTPATIVPPYPIKDRYVKSLGIHKFTNYIQWCSIAYAFTVIGSPAISILCGFTKSGLPVGLQIAGAPRNESKVLSAAAALEESLDLAKILPILSIKSQTTNLL